ncbi:MAG: alanyl-tRNA editing protein [Pseudomonadales bacterium]|jgi:misacylated tRNA(Ala) deacylase
MTERVYYTDPYAQSLNATIQEVASDHVILDQTIFYPLGGGQPGDTGFIEVEGVEYAVTDTLKGDDGCIRHMLREGTASGNLSVGARALLRIDWPRRYAHMRMHTAMHLLGSLIPVPVTGGQVGAEKSRLDFDVGELKLDKEGLTDGMNALIRADSDLEFSWVSDAYLDANPDLVRTMSVAPPRGVGDIRMVRIPHVDYQPCGGTHVHRLSEIGRVRVSKIENKGKQNRRVHLQFDSA